MWVDVGRCPMCGGRMIAMIIAPAAWYGTMPIPGKCIRCGYCEDY